MFKKKDKKKEESKEESKEEKDLTADEAVELLQEKTIKQQAEIERLKAELSETKDTPEDTPEEPAEEKPKKQINQEDLFEISDLPTQTAPFIINSNNPKEVYSELTAICKIMNELKEIKTLLK